MVGFNASSTPAGLWQVLMMH